MTRFLSLFTFSMMVLALAFWAYRENYATQAAIKEVRSLNREIGQAHERLRMLNAEWAYLNRPDRLRELADMNYGRLQLLPLTAERFAGVEDVAHPEPEPEASAADAVMVASDGDDEL